MWYFFACNIFLTFSRLYLISINHTAMLTGEEIKMLRQVRGLFQKQLASKMGIAQQRLSALERGKETSASCTDKVLKALKFTREEAKAILKHLSEVRSQESGVRSQEI
jgi:transcriptional regulator with XRE-family HTH domain